MKNNRYNIPFEAIEDLSYLWKDEAEYCRKMAIDSYDPDRLIYETKADLYEELAKYIIEYYKEYPSYPEPVYVPI